MHYSTADLTHGIGRQSTEASSPPREITILILEDSETDRATYRSYFQPPLATSYAVIEAAAVQAGLSLWESVCPDIVLVNVTLPGGVLQLLQQLQWQRWQRLSDRKTADSRAEHGAIAAATPVPAGAVKETIPVIMLVAAGSERMALQGMKLGAADYLFKEDITATALLTCVSQVYARIGSARLPSPELALQQAEARYSLATRAARLGVWEWNIQTDEFYLDPNIKALLGYTDPEIPNHLDHWSAFIHPDDREAVMSAAQDHLEGKTAEYVCEHRMLHKDGSIVWILVRGQLLRDPQGRPERLLGTDTDITDRKQTELALQRSEAKSRALLAALPDYMFRMGTDGVYREVVANNPTISFFPPNFDPVGQAMDAIVPPAISTRHRYYLKQAIQTQELQVYEQRIKVKNCWRDEEVRVVKSGDDEALFMIRDITERKQIEQQLQQLNQSLEMQVQERTAELQEREARYRALIEVIPDLLIRLRTDGTYLDVIVGENFRLFNPGQACPGANIYDVTPFAHAQKRMLWVQRALQTRLIQSYDDEIVVNGELFSEETRIIAINDEEVLVIVQNISQRKQAERALRESEARWQFALEGQGDGVWDWNLQANTVFYSKQWKSLLGYDDGEIGQGVEECLNRIHPDDVAQVQADLHRHLRGETAFYQNEHRVRCKEGLYKWTLNRGKVIERDSDGQPLRLIGTLADITQRKRAEDKLRESEERYRSVYTQAAVGLANASLEGKLLNVNPRFCELLGYSAAELSRKTVADITHPEDRKRIAPDVERLFAGEVPAFFQEKRYVRKDGSVFWSSTEVSLVRDAAGNPKQTLAVLRDITDRKEAEAALQNLVAGTAATTGQDFFPALVKYISAALNVAYAIVAENRDDRLHTLAFWGNGALQPTWAHPPASTPSQRVLQEGSYYCAEALQEAFPEDAELAQMHVESYLGIVLQDTEGEAIGTLCILDHHSLQDPQRARQILQVFAARAGAELERQRTGLALKQLNQSLEAQVEERTAALKLREAQLQVSNKELEAFAYSVSHDLRAPLRAIGGFSQALLEDYGETLTDEAEDYFSRICRNIVYMERLIDDLLSLSRVSRAEIIPTQVNLSDLAEDLMNELQTSEPNRQVKSTIASNVIVQADFTLMRVILNNLLSNAWKFTSHQPTAQIEFGVIDQDAQIVYFVQDDGAGFDMAYAQKLFGAFQRLHSPQEFSGTGIGLATVQRAIHRHGGHVWAEGAPGQGATFYFTLPDYP